MIKMFSIATLLLISTAPALACDDDCRRARAVDTHRFDRPAYLETDKQVRERHQADMYDQQRKRREQGRDWEPLGGATLQSGEQLLRGETWPD